MLETSERVRQIVESSIASELQEIPRLATCSAAQAYVSDSNKITVNGAWGHRRLSPDEPMSLATRIDIASVSKLFTATVAMLAIDQALLTFDTPIERFFPELKGSHIELLHLLNHSSGLPAWDTFYKRLPMHPDLKTAKHTRQTIETEILAKDRLPAGESYAYSDLGYMLLGYLLEKVFDAPLNHIVRDHISNPLGMSRTDYRSLADQQKPFADAAATENCPQRGTPVIGFVHDENTWIQGGVAGHAGLFSTATDIGRFGEHMLAIDRGEPGILTQKVLQFAWSEAAQSKTGHHRGGWDTPSGQKTSVGRGFSRDASVGHLGFTGTSLWMDRSKSIVAVLLTNRVYPTRDNPRIADLRVRFHEAVVPI